MGRGTSGACAAGGRYTGGAGTHSGFEKVRRLKGAAQTAVNGLTLKRSDYCRGAGYRILVSVKLKGHTVFHSPPCTWAMATEAEVLSL